VTAYVVSPLARQDILDITDHLATDHLDAALRLRDRLFSAFDRPARQPGLGQVRDDLIVRAAGVRFSAVGTYLVIDRPARPGIEIVRVLSGYRDVGAILGQLLDRTTRVLGAARRRNARCQRDTPRWCL
jgi:toxin ParE1/3/4